MNGNMNIQGILKSPYRPDKALCMLRMILGTVFIAHGSQKVLGLFGGPGMDGFVAWAAKLGISEGLATLAAYAELAGGLFLFFGVATELGALLVMSVMVGAIWFVHWDNGYFIQNNGFEYTLNLALLALVVVVGGPGCGSLFDPFKRCR